MTDVYTKVEPEDLVDGVRESPARPPLRYALLGNPNTGKTTLFNRLCGLRSRTANFPGSTVVARRGRCVHGDRSYQVTDLPGTYGLNLNLLESKTCRAVLNGDVPHQEPPEAVVIVVDATNLARNLVFVVEVLRHGLPAIIALNMSDLAERRGLRLDAERLGSEVGCPVVAVNARSGAGIDALMAAMAAPSPCAVTLPADEKETRAWARDVTERSTGRAPHAGDDRYHTVADRLDAIFTHPVLGLIIFAAVMTALFMCIFSVATVPMDLIELVFAQLGAGLSRILPAGAIHDLVVNGVVGGIAGTVVFLPQICLLFFLITLLEDTGYLARAAFVMDRVMRRFGLPGQSFVPLLNAHACAIPAIMSARLIGDRRERLATILVAPFMSCSARLPVYVLLIGILFPTRPLAAGLAFAACYAIGALAAVFTALLVRRTILRGPSRAMVLELPSYKIPSVRTALLTTMDRGLMFLRKAGTVIMGICIVLWWLSAYPVVPPPSEATGLREQAAAVAEVQPEYAAHLVGEADRMESRHAVASSFIGQMGRATEVVFAPIGCDWQLSIGVITSFAAREVFVSTMAVIFAATDDAEDPQVMQRIRNAKRDDGSPVFTSSTAAAVLVFYVLAMQCLPTLVVTRREAGGWRWALVQFIYMSVLAYVAAVLVRLIVLAFGIP